MQLILVAYSLKEKAEWLRVRSICYTIYLSNTSDKSPKSIDTFWPMDDEVNKKGGEGRPLNDDEIAKIIMLHKYGRGNFKN